MAIKIPSPKKKAKKDEKTVDILLDNLEAEPNNKKNLLLGGLVVVALIAVAVVFVLPRFLQSEPEPTPAPPVATAKPAENPAPASDTKTEMAQPAENLRTETVVISGEQLNNNSSSDTAPTPAVQNDEIKVAEPPPAEPVATPVAPPPEQKVVSENKEKKPAKTEVSVQEQGNSLSYADFVKTSEQPVFADR